MSEHPTHRSGQAASRADIARLHEFQRWPSRRLGPLFATLLTLSLLAGELPAAHWPWLFVICPLLGLVSFLIVLAFHDASHDRLHPVRWVNEFYGHLIGTVMLVPLDVYRHAHARHHAYLGTPGDPELWPFNVPGSSRILRVIAAFCEILIGFVYTPFLFLRSVMQGDLTPRERRLIVRGYILCAVVWTTIFVVVYDFALWKLLAITLIVPMSIAGLLQTINKFTQHLGLHGTTVLGLTRTVVDEHKAAELASSAMFYNDYHGTHHRYAKIPYYNLPAATPYTVANARENCPVFPNLASAMVNMLPCLADPKVGPQWVGDKAAWDRTETPPPADTPVAEPAFSGEYDAVVDYLRNAKD